MKSRETLIRLKKFQVGEKRRKVAQIEMMIAEFDRMAGDLERAAPGPDQGTITGIFTVSVEAMTTTSRSRTPCAAFSTAIS